MLNIMKKAGRAGVRSPEHDSTHGLRTVRLFSYRRPQSRLQTTADVRDAVGGVRMEDGT
jgi:hypothetical protein